MAATGKIHFPHTTPDTVGDAVYTEVTNGAAHVAASMDNLVKKVNGDGAYAATIRGIWVATAPTASDTSITVNGTALTSIPAAAFSVGQVYPIDATSVTVGTGGVFYIWIA